MGTDDYDTTFGPYKTGKMGDASVTASSWRLVERGRVVLFKKGQYAGKLAAIAQIIDHRRVLVEGFSSDASKMSAKLMRRRQLNDFERFKVMVLRKQARF